MSFAHALRRCAVTVQRRGFHSTAMRHDFGWAKLVTPSTPASFISRMKELDSKMAAMRAESAGVAPEVEPIDWATFENSVSDKALVARLRKEYESQTFADIPQEDLTKINADLDFAISKATGAAELSKQELPSLRAELDAAKREKVEVHNWDLDEYQRRYPGLEQQLQEEYMNADYLPTDAEERLDAQDVSEARKSLKSGNEITIPDDLPDRVGDFSYAEERAKVDQLLQKMFGESKTFQARLAAERAAEEKKSAEAAHH